MFLLKHGIEGTLNFCYCCSINPIQVDANVYILTSGAQNRFEV
jgi:hypothetical protein